MRYKILNIIACSWVCIILAPIPKIPAYRLASESRNQESVVDNTHRTPLNMHILQMGIAQAILRDIRNQQTNTTFIEWIIKHANLTPK